jgi:CRP/FNR family cyclic AMP-dependent transcriptional regulator
MAEIVEVLAQHRFFAGLDPITLRILAGCAVYERFEQGKWIMRQGGKANRFYVIYNGRVSLEFTSPKCGTVILETLGEGDVLGASWLFEPYRCHWDARALEPALTMAFNAKCLRAICEDDHDIGYELMKRFSNVMIKRLQEARLKGSDIYHVCAK